MRFFVFLCFCVFVYANDLTQIVKLEVKKINIKDKTLILEKKNQKQGIYIGESGVLIYDMGDGVISNEVIITNINGEEIEAQYKTFSFLEQNHLPTPHIKPQVGDEVLLRSLNKRAFVIAPNQAVFDEIKKSNDKIMFMNPDLMVADIDNKAISSPSKKAFMDMCQIYSVGLIYIYATNGVNILDCRGFKVLQTQNKSIANDHEDINFPFFSRVKAKGIFDWMKGKQEYYPTYDKIIQDAQ